MKRMGYFLLAMVCLLTVTAPALGQNPPAPVNLEARLTQQIPPGIELKWQMPPIMPPVPLTVFKVFRAVDDSANFSLLNVTNTAGYNDRQVVPGHTYFYCVTAVWIRPDSTIHESGKSSIARVPFLPPPGGIAGEITGTVTDSLTGRPIAHARVLFFRPLRPILWAPQTMTDSLGRYRAVLDTGTYIINCQAPAWMAMSMSPLPPYKPEWYDNASEPAQATPVLVTAGSSKTINFDLVRFVLPPLAHIRGTVRDSAGNPLRGALVMILRTVQEIQQASDADDGLSNIAGETMDVDGLGCIRGVVWKGLTDSSGRYDATVLVGRWYHAMATAMGYMPQYYDHVSNPAEAKVIKVSGDVSAVDFNLNPFRPPHLYSISGVVRDSNGVRVPSRIIVFPLRPRPINVGVRFGHTDSLGAYTIPRLFAGKYIVLAIPFGRYAPAFYKEGAYGVIRWKNADTVSVSGNVTGIDIGVVRFHCAGIARLTGIVRSLGAGLGGVNILALNGDGAAVGYGLSDNTGAYSIENLAAGYLTLVVDREGYDPAQVNLTVRSTDFTIAQDLSLGVTTGVTEEQSVPVNYVLGQNYPNPFNPSTRIAFQLPVAARVTLRIYNLLGQQIATLVDGPLGAGSHERIWNGRDATGTVMASGVYFYRLEATGAGGKSDFAGMRKMILLK